MFKLKTHQWRHFQNTCFEIPRHNFFLIDNNGTGKTSVISAMYSLITKKPWPGTIFRDSITYNKKYFGLSFGDNKWYLSGELNQYNRLILKGNLPEFQTWSRFKLNSKPKVISYTPLDNYWLKNGNRSKIKEIDSFLESNFNNYNNNSKNLNKNILEKNKLIRYYLENNVVDWNLLKIINNNIQKYSNFIWKEREMYFKFINQRLNSIRDILNLKNGNLMISWKKNLNTEIKLFQDLSSTITECKPNWNSLWHKEVLVGRSLWSAQRDEIAIFNNQEDVTKYFSQGENRILTLFLKEKSLEYLKSFDKNIPVWLFIDDVLSELDIIRENFLVDKLFEKSDWVVGTSTNLQNKNIKSYKISDLIVEC